MRRPNWLWLLCSTCLLLVSSTRPAFAWQEAPAAHVPAGPDPQFSRNAALIISLESLSIRHARRIDTARGAVCRLRAELGRPPCPPPPPSAPVHSEAATPGAQRHEIARLRGVVAGQRQTLTRLTSLQARLEAERARRPQ